MRRIALIGLMLMVGGCTDSPLPTITNVNTNTNILNGGGGIQDPNAVAGTCTPAEDKPIRVDLNVPVTAVVGTNTPIDATPKSAEGKISDQCNLAHGIFWSTAPSSTCTVPNPSEFNTVMRCLAPGACQMTATVPGKGASGTSSVLCQ